MSAMGSVIVMARGASLTAVPRALGLGDLAQGLSAIGGAVVRSGRLPVPSYQVLPAGLADARQFAGVRHLPQADPAQAELAEDRVRTAAPLATGVSADGELRLAVRLLDQSLLGHVFVSYRLSGWWPRRADRRRGSRAGGAAHDPRRRSWRW